MFYHRLFIFIFYFYSKSRGPLTATRNRSVLILCTHRLEIHQHNAKWGTHFYTLLKLNHEFQTTRGKVNCKPFFFFLFVLRFKVVCYAHLRKSPQYSYFKFQLLAYCPFWKYHRISLFNFITCAKSFHYTNHIYIQKHNSSKLYLRNQFIQCSKLNLTYFEIFFMVYIDRTDFMVVAMWKQSLYFFLLISQIRSQNFQRCKYLGNSKTNGRVRL